MNVLHTRTTQTDPGLETNKIYSATTYEISEIENGLVHCHNHSSLWSSAGPRSCALPIHTSVCSTVLQKKRETHFNPHGQGSGILQRIAPVFRTRIDMGSYGAETLKPSWQPALGHMPVPVPQGSPHRGQSEQIFGECHGTHAELNMNKRPASVL